MKTELQTKSTSHFLLRLTAEEKKRLHIAVARNNTTITSLIRYLLNTTTTLDDLLKEN
jgi:hypothetical protein